MHLVTNLKFVKHSGNGVGRGQHDGIYKRGKDVYITFCHGEADGTLTLQMNKTLYFTTPCQLRGFIHTCLGVPISDKDRLFINPCYTEAVKERYGRELKENNVFIYSKKDGIYTWFFVGSAYGKRVDMYEPIGKRRKVHMMVFDQGLFSDKEIYMDADLCNTALKEKIKRAKRVDK